MSTVTTIGATISAIRRRWLHHGSGLGGNNVEALPRTKGWQYLTAPIVTHRRRHKPCAEVDTVDGDPLEHRAVDERAIVEANPTFVPLDLGSLPVDIEADCPLALDLEDLDRS